MIPIRMCKAITDMMVYEAIAASGQKIPSFDEVLEEYRNKFDNLMLWQNNLIDEPKWFYEAFPDAPILGPSTEPFWKDEAWVALVEDYTTKNYQEEYERSLARIQASSGMCWRGMRLPRTTDPASLETLGKYWTMTEGVAKVYSTTEGPGAGKVDVIFEARINPEDVDYMETLSNRIDIDFGREEDELCYREGGKVFVTGWHYEGDDEFHPISEWRGTSEVSRDEIARNLWSEDDPKHPDHPKYKRH